MSVPWWGGALMNIGGSIISNLGQNVMKLGHNDRFDIPEDKRPPLQ